MKEIVIFIIWAWLTGGFLYLVIAERGPFYFLSPVLLLVVVEEVKLFFVLIILPLVLSRTTVQTILNYGLFTLLFLPLTVMGAVSREATCISLITAELLLLFIWSILAILVRTAGNNSLRWWYLVVFSLSAGLPISYYLSAELFGTYLTGLLYLNPFWLISKILA